MNLLAPWSSQSLADFKDIEVMTSKFCSWRHEAGKTWVQSHQHKSLCVIKISPGPRKSESTDFNCYLLPQSFLTPKEGTLSLELFIIVYLISDIVRNRRQFKILVFLWLFLVKHDLEKVILSLWAVIPSSVPWGNGAFYLLRVFWSWTC